MLLFKWWLYIYQVYYTYICIIYIYSLHIYSYICPHVYGSFLQQSLEHCILHTYGRGHVPWILVAKVHHEPLDLATRQKGTITSRWSAGSVAATAAGCTVRCTGETKWIARLFDGFESEDQLLLEVKISYFWIFFLRILILLLFDGHLDHMGLFTDIYGAYVAYKPFN